jgi:hypothetical protein
MKKILFFLPLLFLLLLYTNAFAVPIAWTDWVSADDEGHSNSAEGNISLPGSGDIGIHYSGDLRFYQTSYEQTVYKENFWIEHSPAPYTGNPIVDNAPPAYELLALDFPTTHTVTFDQPVTNPVMAILSQGQIGFSVNYDFDTPFIVLSEGYGRFGDGFYNHDTIDNILTGEELHGVIQFQGQVTSISWTSSPGEYWHGITFGVPVPEPSTMFLLSAGMFGIAVLGRKKFLKK